MTIKERITEFVLKQGNQVGAGAELAAILNDIVDSIPGAYTLPPATAETLGGIKVGQNLSITEEGVLSASGGGAAPLIVNFSELTLDDGLEDFQSPVYTIPASRFSELESAFQAGRLIVILKNGYGAITNGFDTEVQTANDDYVKTFHLNSNLRVNDDVIFEAQYIVQELIP